MKRIFLYPIVGVILLAVVFLACDARRDILDDKTFLVRVTIHWDHEDHVPNGTSIYFYSELRNLPVRVLKTNQLVDSIALPKDDYSIILINETAEDHDYIYFSGVDQYSTFEVHAKENHETKSNEQFELYTPGYLATVSMPHFEVNEQAAGDDHIIDLELSPIEVIVPVRVKIHFKGLEYVSKDGGYIRLGGMPSGLNLSTRKKTEHYGIFRSDLTGKKFYQGSAKDGLMETKFSSYGLMAEPTVPQILYIYLKLRNDTYKEVIVRDVSKIIQRTEYGLLIEIGDENGGTPDNKSIVIDKVPDVEKVGSGFDVEINDWEDGGTIEMPIDK